jgi:hypothetical protein
MNDYQDSAVPSQNRDDSNEVINAVLEWTKQVTTLSSGTLVLSATFIKDIFQGNIENQMVLIWSWILFAVSAVSGVMLMGNLCYLFSKKSQGIRTIYNCTTRIIALIHLFAFVVGLCLFVYFASHNFLNKIDHTTHVDSNQQTVESLTKNSSEKTR